MQAYKQEAQRLIRTECKSVIALKHASDNRNRVLAR
jgi:hypothetical protein